MKGKKNRVDWTSSSTALDSQAFHGLEYSRGLVCTLASISHGPHAPEDPIGFQPKPSASETQHEA